MSVGGTSVLYLDDLTTVEHLVPLLPALTDLGPWHVWVSFEVDRTDFRWEMFSDSDAFSVRVVRRLEFFFYKVLLKVAGFGRVQNQGIPPSLLRVICAVWPLARQMKSVNRYVCGWGDSWTFMFLIAHGLRVPTFQIPHGFSPYLNRQITDDLVAGDPEEQKFNDRNMFDAIVAQSPNLAEWLRSFSVADEKILVLGSPRFSPEWIRKLDRMAREKFATLVDEVDVLFLLPNPNYRIDHEAVQRVVEMLANSSLAVTVGFHPRTWSLAGGKEVVQTLTALKRPGLELSALPAYSLIPFARFVVASGTSAGLHAIGGGRPFRNLSFLSENQTIYERVDGMSLPSLMAFEEFLRAISHKTPIYSPATTELEGLFESYVDFGFDLAKLLENYTRALGQLSRDLPNENSG